MIILGLGNPGKKYEHTRHNAGAIALATYVERCNLLFTENKMFDAALAREEDTVFALPLLFMNDAGIVAKKLLREYLGPLVVVHDEINVPLGEVKCSYERGSGDHNGVQSVIDHLGHKQFFRIRIGVRPIHDELLPRIAPPDGFEKFLLSDFTPMEEEKLKEGIDKAVQIISELEEKSFAQLMNEYN